MEATSINPNLSYFYSIASISAYDIGVSEIKHPSNFSSNNSGESDEVKVGKEMSFIIHFMDAQDLDKLLE